MNILERRLERLEEESGINKPRLFVFFGTEEDIEAQRQKQKPQPEDVIYEIITGRKNGSP